MKGDTQFTRAKHLNDLYFLKCTFPLTISSSPNYRLTERGDPVHSKLILCLLGEPRELINKSRE